MVLQMVYLCTALNLLQNGGMTFLVFARDVHDVFEMKFVEKNVLYGCAIHLLHGMHMQVNL